MLGSLGRGAVEPKLGKSRRMIRRFGLNCLAMGIQNCRDDPQPCRITRVFTCSGLNTS